MTGAADDEEIAEPRVEPMDEAQKERALEGLLVNARAHVISNVELRAENRHPCPGRSPLSSPSSRR
jgi:hypothetical protein